MNRQERKIKILKKKKKFANKINNLNMEPNYKREEKY